MAGIFSTNLLFSSPWKSNAVFFVKEYNIEAEITNQSADIFYVSKNDLWEIIKFLYEKTLKAVLKVTLYWFHTNPSKKDNSQNGHFFVQIYEVFPHL